MLALLTGLPASAQEVPLEQALAERTLGKADAAITIIEFASLTCPHCAAFDKETLPKLKAAYIDTGKAKLVFRDFPLDGLALRAAALARCAPADRYFPMLNILFQQQDSWSRAKDPLDALAKIGRLAGMSQQTIDACLKSDKLMDGVVNIRLEAERQFKIESTPTFVINGTKISGAQPFEEFDRVLKPLAKP
ncbi:MAG: DsbA family protein [Proteobacteria bacterium]|nr:DsbA family protein [Pseudomonadota bacterium]MBI3498297.1 DsbA family protein [Pseudomonadota bacterium]